MCNFEPIEIELKYIFALLRAFIKNPHRYWRPLGWWYLKLQYFKIMEMLRKVPKWDIVIKVTYSQTTVQVPTLKTFAMNSKTV